MTIAQYSDHAWRARRGARPEEFLLAGQIALSISVRVLNEAHPDVAAMMKALEPSFGLPHAAGSRRLRMRGKGNSRCL